MSAEPVERPRLAEIRKLRAEQPAVRAATVIGQLPLPIDLVVYQGDDIFINVDVGGVADLTGFTAKAEIRSSAGGTLIATFNATIAGPTQVALHLPALQSTKLTSNAVWDVQVTDSAGKVTTLAAGKINVTKQVTQ